MILSCVVWYVTWCPVICDRIRAKKNVNFIIVLFIFNSILLWLVTSCYAEEVPKSLHTDQQLQNILDTMWLCHKYNIDSIFDSKIQFMQISRFVEHCWYIVVIYPILMLIAHRKLYLAQTLRKGILAAWMLHGSSSFTITSPCVPSNHRRGND